MKTLTAEELDVLERVHDKSIESGYLHPAYRNLYAVAPALIHMAREYLRLTEEIADRQADARFENF